MPTLARNQHRRQSVAQLCASPHFEHGLEDARAGDRSAFQPPAYVLALRYAGACAMHGRLPAPPGRRRIAEVRWLLGKSLNGGAR
jgi:hypothetical protein